jgi:hypothetical protein
MSPVPSQILNRLFLTLIILLCALTLKYHLPLRSLCVIPFVIFLAVIMLCFTKFDPLMTSLAFISTPLLTLLLMNLTL